MSHRVWWLAGRGSHPAALMRHHRIRTTLRVLAPIGVHRCAK